MVRTIVIPDKQSISFDIPNHYIGKQIEVIVFAKDEGIAKTEPFKKALFTVLHVDAVNYKFNRDEANER